jgi:16S rRNA (guanine966-N2)-methyltransferase
MRVISGKFKGRSLVTFQADHIRPTTDRVKESLFNIIQAEVENAIALDLFAGTGSLGIEALSRGAQKVTFVEKNKKSLQIVKENLNQLGVEAEVLAEDVFDFMKDKPSTKYDLIFIDPPFTEVLGDKIMSELAKSEIFAENVTVAIETGTKEPISKEYGQLKCVTQRVFGDKTLSIFRRFN